MDTEELQSRLEDYNKNRGYGWTIESLAKDGDENDDKDEVKAVSEPPKSGGESELEYTIKFLSSFTCTKPHITKYLVFRHIFLDSWMPQ